MLYFADSPVPPIPTIRIGTGPDVSKHLYEVAIDGLTYPAIVKPAGWCGGGGVNLAHSSEDVRGLVSLAQGGDTTLVAQPYLGDGTIDYRVYVVDGEPYSVMRRTPEPGSPVANASRGGDMAFPPIPPELAEATAYFAGSCPTSRSSASTSSSTASATGSPSWSPTASSPPTGPTPTAPSSATSPAPAGPPTATPTPDSWRPLDDRLLADARRRPPRPCTWRRATSSG